MKNLVFSLFLVMALPLVSFGQVRWDEFLVSEFYTKWDSIKCKEFYDIAEYNIGYIDTAPTFIGIDKVMKKKVYPNVPSGFIVSGKVFFRFVLSKENTVECLKVYSALPKAYVDVAIAAFKELEFIPASNHGQSLDFRMIYPITFSQEEYIHTMGIIEKKKKKRR